MTKPPFCFTFFLLLCLALPLMATAQTVNIPDTNLRATVEAALGKAPGDTITVADMGTLTRLQANDADISDLTGLEFASDLRSLTLDEQQISDISPLATLTRLEWLDLSDNQISAIGPLTGLTQLEGLNLWGNQISDINSLTDLIRLKTLYLGDNQVSDIRALANLTQLEKLILSDSQISDISPLSNLTRLEDLALRHNQISDISPLSNLTRLEDLELWHNQITNIAPLATLTRLRTLDLHDNQVSDISALANLTRLEGVNLWDNQVSDISALANLTRLEGVNFWNNQISNITPLINLTRLETLYLGTNQITDITPLAGLTSLTRLSLERNNISDISALVVNTGLSEGDEVNVGRNPLSYQSIRTHIPALQNRGVTVKLNNLEPPILEYLLLIPAGISLIHVPLKVNAVDGVEKTIESISDLYSALGGTSKVNFLITYDSKTQEWHSYFGAVDTGTTVDRTLTDDMGVIAGTIAPGSVRLTGSPLGTDGSSTITLNQGLNLVGLPLRDSRINRVSDLFTLEEVGGNVPVIILTDGEDLKVVGRARDPGDISIIGGQSFIMTAQREAMITISGDAWYNSSVMATAPPIGNVDLHSIIPGIQVTHTTSVLALRGLIVDEETGMNQVDIGVTVKNLSSGREATATVIDETGYRLTVVDIESKRAATVGDVLEVSAQSPNPFIGLQPLWYTVTAEDVRQNLIQLPALIAYEIPAETELLANYPNPFNPETWIPYRLAEDAFVTLTIYDTEGRVIRTLEVGHQIASAYENRSKAIYWDGRNDVGERVASGVYFYNLAAGDYSATRRMVILK